MSTSKSVVQEPQEWRDGTAEFDNCGKNLFDAHVSEIGHCIIRKMPKKKLYAPARKTKPSKARMRSGTNHLIWIRALGGLAFVIGGWQLMAISYVSGLVIVYLGFILCLVECIKEPELVAGPYPLQIGLVVCVFVFAASFSIGVVLVQGPLKCDAYAMRKGQYSPGENISGIIWDSHFTALRVSVTNPSNDDYRDLDIVVQPDAWNYKASMIDENTDCKLGSIGGNAVLIVPSNKGGARKVTTHRVGANFEVEDDAGDVFEHFVQEGGYRLRCAKFPAHFTVQILFALAAPNRELAAQIAPKNLKPNEWGIGMAELKPENKFDLLDPRPTTSAVHIEGHHTVAIRKISSSLNIRVDDGN